MPITTLTLVDKNREKTKLVKKEDGLIYISNSRIQAIKNPTPIKEDHIKQLNEKHEKFVNYGLKKL